MNRPLEGSVRHYLRRRGRMTRGQARALEEHAQRVSFQGHDPLAPLVPIDWHAVFDNPARPMGLEIGFGMGHALVQWSEQAPDWNLVGLEVYQPGIGAALLLADAADALDRLFVIEADARRALDVCFAPASLQEIRVFFPDPWPKARHHKRRLIQPEFVSALAARLCAGGSLRLATDWQAYAHHMLEVLNSESQLRNAADAGFAPRFAERNVTRFEARGQSLGHEVWDLHFVRV